MAYTYDSIQSYSASGSQSTIVFSVIPQTYTDLVLVCNVRGTANNEDLTCFLNNDNGGSDYNYMWCQLTSTGTTLAGAGYWTGQPIFRIGDYVPNSTTWAGTETHFLNYSNTSVKKTMLSTSFGTSAIQQFSALYADLSAISKISIKLGGQGNFAAGSTFTLYGIKAA